MKKLSASILSKKNNYIETINLYNNLDIDYLHLDIMDNTFVNNNSYTIKDIYNIISISKKKLDVHLMVNDPIKYIELFDKNNTEIITFHFEVLNDHTLIEMIKNKNIKVGISIKPSTQLESIFPLLKYIDLVLLMSVEPGKSGQSFIEETYERTEKLKQEIIKNKYNVEISVDGGINENNISKLDKVDIIVVDSALANSNNINKTISILKV
jgi:ribulose-phosphate 3-epimerase